MQYDFTSINDRRAIGSRKWSIVPDEVDPLNDKMYPLTIADMDFAPVPEIKTALQSFVGHNILGYTAPTPSYLQAVCDFFEKQHQVTLDPEWIVTTPGVVAALAAAVRAFTREGDKILIFTPVYPPFYRVIREQGREVVKCPLVIAQDGMYHMDFANLESLLSRENIKLLFVCNPHNPAGRVWTATDLSRLAKLAQENNCMVISDEIHADLTYPDIAHTMYFKALTDFTEAAMVCTSAAKAFNIPGLQTSNIFIPRSDLREKFQNELAASGIQPANILGLYATEVAYTQALPWREEVLQVIKTNYNLVRDFFANLDNRFEVMPVQASFLAWVNCAKFGVKREQLAAVFRAVCFFVADGADFGSEGDYYFRINFGLPTAELQACLDNFAEKISPYLHSIE